MIISINQPAYLPWLGYFNRIIKSNLHVVLDTVQFEKNSFINRNKIIINQAPVWLTVPVLTKNLFGYLDINAIEIDHKVPWQKKHILKNMKGLLIFLRKAYVFSLIIYLLKHQLFMLLIIILQKKKVILS